MLNKIFETYFLFFILKNKRDECILKISEENLKGIKKFFYLVSKIT